jgi:hypothetical protein
METRNNAIHENCVLDDQDSISGKDSDHSLQYHDQTGYGTHRANYPIEGTETRE